MDKTETLIAHKMKVRFNNKQASWMKDNCIACRLAYNFAIERLRNPIADYAQCIDAAENNEPAKLSSRIDGFIQPAMLDMKKVKFPTAFDVSKQWTLQRDRLHPWMKQRKLNMDTISGVFNNNYGAALNQWKVAKWNKDKMPTFHGKGKGLSSIWRGRNFKQIDERTFELPNKRGTFKLGCALRFHGEIRSVTFSESGGDWFASFLIKAELPAQQPAPAGTAIGIDVGVAQFASLSDGQQFPPGTDYDRELDKLAKLQRAASRMQGPIARQRKASKNWLKQNRKIQKHHQHIANKRRHYTEVVSKEIAANYQTVAIEDLQLKNMTKSAKGDAVKPGKNVAAKAGLNRSILNGGFGQFRTRLTAKVVARQGQVIAVNPAYTSQTCAACGHVAKENRKDQAHFECVNCGYAANADINAAQNILIRALSGIQETSPPVDDKEAGQQEPSTPVSLPTVPIGELAQETNTQGALIRTAKAESTRKKRVKQVKQLDLLLGTST